MESRINGHTRLFALIGSPVGHSGSPAMHNYSFARRGIDAAYLAFDVPEERTADAIWPLTCRRSGRRMRSKRSARCTQGDLM